MADQREITLRQGDATPRDIVLHELPAAAISAGTIIYLFEGDATARDIILRDPTTAPAAVSASASLAWVEDDDTIAIAEEIPCEVALAWTEDSDVHSVAALAVSLAQIGWTEADDAVAIDATVAAGTDEATLAWTEDSDAHGLTVAVEVTNDSAGFWGANPYRFRKPRKAHAEEAFEPIEAAQIIQRISDDSKDRARAADLERSLAEATSAAQYRAMESRIRWATALAREVQRREDDDISAVMALLQ